jgi:hypothetical protein
MLALLLVLGMSTLAFAANPAQVFVHVYVVSGTVSIANASGPSITFPQIVQGTSAVTAGSVDFVNDGDTISDWTVYCSYVSSGWTLKADAPAVITGPINECRLSGLFTTGTPGLADFVVDDVIGVAARTCSNDNFAITSYGPEVKGFNVAGAQHRYLFFRFDAPITGSSNMASDQFFTVVVTAVMHV